MKKLSYFETTIHLDVNFRHLATLIPPDVSQVVLVVDAQVMGLEQYDFSAWNCIELVATEQNKSLETVEKLCRLLLDMNLDRKSLLIGVGGGITCDLVGFAASIFLRGIRFGFVPTTLLAQVDAAIGGKNGVNFGSLKNMLGVIRQPEFLLIDSQFLNTLPQREVISGLAEVIKHACIKNAHYFDFIEAHLEDILDLNTSVLEEVLHQSILIKTQIVNLDSLEKGPRKLLNYGHTFGHAIEVKHGILHGEAVSLGMICVNEIAVHEGIMARETANRIQLLLDKVGLPTDFFKYWKEDILDHVVKDKKRTNAQLDLVLVSDIGQSEIKSYNVDELRSMLLKISERHEK